MDPSTVFVVLITVGALGLLAYIELTSRKRRRMTAPAPEAGDTVKGERSEP